jgi:hypothetical protein
VKHGFVLPVCAQPRRAFPVDGALRLEAVLEALGAYTVALSVLTGHQSHEGTVEGFGAFRTVPVLHARALGGSGRGSLRKDAACAPRQAEARESVTLRADLAP